MMMALGTNLSQQGRGERESREMAESPILHELPRIRSVIPGKSPSPHSSTTTVAAPPDSYFALQPHSPKFNETQGIRYVDVEKSETDIGVAVTTQTPDSPSSPAPSASPYTPISPSLFPIPPSRSSTPNVSVTTLRSQSATPATKRSGLSSLGDVSMTTLPMSPATPATSFNSPASTPTLPPPKRTCLSPRLRLMPSTPSPVYSPRSIGSRSPRIYAESGGGGIGIDANNGLYIETRRSDAENLASKRLRLDRRRSRHSEHSAEPPRSPAYSGSWLEVPDPRPGLGSRSTSGASGYSTASSSPRTDADSDSISPILSRPALLKAFHSSNGHRHSVKVVPGGDCGGDYDTHSLSAMWFGETRRKNYDFVCAGGPEPDFAVAVVQERQRRRRRARRVKMAGGVAVIAVLVVVAIVVGVSLSVR
ncbi:hypothetical protein F5X99DRAFT_230956 [Biscogniauxia marginata]|nr:hypothetical protein F5X99DRAFT_230956 [Biscogniauxia marginata]